MKNKSNSIKEPILFTIITRLFAFPFFSGIALVGAIIMWAKWVINFVKYGGESIAYTDRMNRKTIQDVFEKLTEQHNKYY